MKVESGSSRVGTRVADKYDLVRVIGSGGTSVVYEGEHVVTKRRVAVKCISASVALSIPTIALRFLREARAASTIAHDGLVDVLDAGQESDGGLYLVLELLDGQDLDEALRSRSVVPDDVVGICTDVLVALEAAHERGFIHRDVKPANIFLARTRSGESCVKLLDFGIAKSVGGESISEITARGTLLGTLHFMSPEQAAANVADHRSDVWGVGATLFYAYAFRPPFCGNTAGELLRTAMNERPPPLLSVAPNAPPDVAAVVDRALQRDPKARFQSAREMREALVAASRETLLEFAKTQETIPGPEPVRSRAHLWIGAAFLGVFVVGALIAVRSISKAKVPVEVVLNAPPPPTNNAEVRTADRAPELEPESEPDPEADPDPDPDPEPAMRATPDVWTARDPPLIAPKRLRAKSPPRRRPDDPMRDYK